MILVDTSIWIELLSPTTQFALQEEHVVKLATCGPVIQEVLQGIRPGRRGDLLRETFLTLPVLSDPLSRDLFIMAGDIYQNGRTRGFTIRSSIDCLIAAIAIQNRVPVWHNDRDFDAIARYTPLQVAEPPRAQ